MNQTLSLMIPRVFPQWINNKEIAKVFADQQIGKVYKVIIRHTKTEYKNGVKIPIYTARVYFHYWYNNEIAYNFQQQIIKKKQARIVYDDPWFWTIFENIFVHLDMFESVFGQFWKTTSYAWARFGRVLGVFGLEF